MNISKQKTDSAHFLIPPYILKHLAESADKEVRRAAVEMIASSSAMRAVRRVLATMPIMAAIPSVERKKERLVYDMKHSTSRLPGALVLREGSSSAAKNKEVREAFANLGLTFDFYDKVFRRNSLDNNGMSLIASVHYGRGYNNAFWNGEQMVFGNGDGKIFVAFTRSLDVVAHELSHGVVTHTCNLDYQDQSGALNEHFADVFGALTEQWHLGQTADKASWLIGAEIMGPKTKAKAIRTFKAEKAFENDPILGTDPQPKHMKDFYTGKDDDGGVHLNSGIPNNAFYRAAIALGGKGWETVGPIWYKTLSRLNRGSAFAEAAKATIDIARCDCGAKSREVSAIKAAWKAVGVKVAS